MHTPSAVQTEDVAKEKRRAELLASRSTSRAKLLNRLEDEGAEVHAKRLRKCGEKLRLKCTCCGFVRSVAIRCDLKWCPSCAPRIAHDKTEKYGPVVDDFTHPLFVTFTTRNFDARSKTTTGMREVVRAFKRLRCQRWWKRACAGGVASFEMTRRQKGWHPHVHALLDSAWFAATVTRPPVGCSSATFKHRATLACNELSEQWTLALGGRKGTVKVRKIRVREGQTVGDSLKEVMKYSVTAESLDSITGKVGMLLDELSLTRNLVSFGSAYRHPALKKKKHGGKPCEDCGEEGTMMPADVVEAYASRLDHSVGDERKALKARNAAVTERTRAAMRERR